MTMDPIYFIAVFLSVAVAVAATLLRGLLASPSAKGASGERRVARALRRELDPEQYRVLHDVTLPSRGGTTQIDHVVLSPFGVFVIETKNMTGWIFGDEAQGQWTQVLHRKKSRFQNPLRQNFGHVRTLQDLWGPDAGPIHSIVAFVGGAVPKTPMADSVVWSCRDLVAQIAQHKDRVIPTASLDAFAARIAAARLEPGREAQAAHVRHVKELVAARAPNGSGCPKCGGEMVERVTRKTGERFLGCASFPKCRGMRPSHAPENASIPGAIP